MHTGLTKPGPAYIRSSIASVSILWLVKWQGSGKMKGSKPLDPIPLSFPSLPRTCSCQPSWGLLMRVKFGLIGLSWTSGNPIIVRPLPILSLLMLSSTCSADTVQRGFSFEPDQLSSSSGISLHTNWLFSAYFIFRSKCRVCHVDCLFARCYPATDFRNRRSSEASEGIRRSLQ